jgi:hypothetical protein
MYTPVIYISDIYSTRRVSTNSNHIMFNMFASSAVDRGFEPQLGQT